MNYPLWVSSFFILYVLLSNNLVLEIVHVTFTRSKLFVKANFISVSFVFVNIYANVSKHKVSMYQYFSEPL